MSFKTENSQIQEYFRLDIKAQKQFQKKSSFAFKSVALFINSPCANNCIFCLPEKDASYTQLAEVRKKIQNNLKLKEKNITIGGKDPLLHPKIIEIVTLCKKNGFKNIEIMTSGEKLADLVFLKELVKAGATSFAVPLYGRKQDTHDKIVGNPGSYKKILKGLKNMISLNKKNIRKIKIYVHTILLKHNLQEIAAMEKYIKKDLELPFITIPLNPKNPAISYNTMLVTKADILKIKQPALSLKGFPLCLLKGTKFSQKTHTKNIAEAIKQFLLTNKFIKDLPCLKCPESKSCPGKLY
jgi:MoaA/NifB/PqqE/SkfB family radical SAM enzyme